MRELPLPRPGPAVVCLRHCSNRSSPSVHKELIKRLDLDKLSEFSETRTGQQQLFGVIQQLLGEQGVPLSGAERDKLAQEVVDEVFGLGPLEPLLKDETISDILVNTYKHVYVERRGVLEKTGITFNDERHLMHTIDKIVSAVGRRVDESSPMVDARLLDGSRVNAIIPPLAVDGAILSIRRFGSKPLQPEDLIRNQMFDRADDGGSPRRCEGTAEYHRVGRNGRG